MKISKHKRLIWTLLIFIPPTLVGLFFLFLYSSIDFAPTTIEIEKSSYKNQYCFVIKDPNQMPLVAGTKQIRIDHPLASLLKLPSNLFDRMWCIQDKSHVNGQKIEVFNLLADEGRNEYECTPQGLVAFRQGCFKAEFNQKFTEFKFPHEFNYVCPTTYLSDMEKFGSREKGQIILEFQMMYPAAS